MDNLKFGYTYLNVKLSDEDKQHLLFALNIAVNTCAPGNKERMKEIREKILEGLNPLMDEVNWASEMVGFQLPRK